MTETKKLYRSQTDRVIFGVAGGIGEYFEVDPIIVRLIFVLLTIWGGAGLLFYIIAALVIPEAPSYEKRKKTVEGEVVDDKKGSKAKEETKTKTEDFTEKTKAAAQDIKSNWEKKPNRGGQTFGLIILLLGLFFLMQNYLPWISFAKLWPLVIIFVGVAILVGGRKEV